MSALFAIYPFRGSRLRLINTVTNLINLTTPLDNSADDQLIIFFLFFFFFFFFFSRKRALSFHQIVSIVSYFPGNKLEKKIKMTSADFIPRVLSVNYK